MSSEEIRERTQGVWDNFYGLPAIWSARSASDAAGSPGVSVISKLYRQMYAKTGFPPIARVVKKQRDGARLAIPCRKLFAANPMPDLEMPASVLRPFGSAASAGFPLLAEGKSIAFYPITRRRKPRMPAHPSNSREITSAPRINQAGICGKARSQSRAHPSLMYTIGFNSTEYCSHGICRSSAHG